MNKKQKRVLYRIIITIVLMIGIIIAQWLRIHGVQTVIATGHNINHGKSMKKLADASYIYLDACDEADVTEQVMKLTADGALEVL